MFISTQSLSFLCIIKMLSTHCASFIWLNTVVKKDPYTHAALKKTEEKQRVLYALCICCHLTTFCYCCCCRCCERKLWIYRYHWHFHEVDMASVVWWQLFMYILPSTRLLAEWWRKRATEQRLSDTTEFDNIDASDGKPFRQTLNFIAHKMHGWKIRKFMIGANNFAFYFHPVWMYLIWISPSNTVIARQTFMSCSAKAHII